MNRLQFTQEPPKGSSLVVKNAKVYANKEDNISLVKVFDDSTLGLNFWINPSENVKAFLEENPHLPGKPLPGLFDIYIDNTFTYYAIKTSGKVNPYLEFLKVGKKPHPPHPVDYLITGVQKTTDGKKLTLVLYELENLLTPQELEELRLENPELSVNQFLFNIDNKRDLPKHLDLDSVELEYKPVSKYAQPLILRHIIDALERGEIVSLENTRLKYRREK